MALSELQHDAHPSHAHRYIRSLREHLQNLERLDELRHIDTAVDLHLEAGAIVRRICEKRAPAALMSKLTSADPGFRLLGAMYAASRAPDRAFARCALAMGFDPDASAAQMVEAIYDALHRTGIPPRRVSTAPCQQNVWTGDAVDLNRLPVPLLHEGDGGRYISTEGVIVARSPDGAWVNWSIARIMLVAGSKTKMTGMVAGGQHIGMVHQMWRERGEDMPVAVALGAEPMACFAAGMPLPDFANEVDFLGAYHGEPVPVVPCKTIPVEVPASAEIVLEATLSISETAQEGPMGEYAGYQSRGKSVTMPVYNVQAVTFRDNAILPTVCAGMPVDDLHTMGTIPWAGKTLQVLREAGLPITAAWFVPEGAAHILALTVPLDWRAQGNLRDHDDLMTRIGEAYFGTKGGYAVPKIMVMHDDINPANTAEVMWAFATRHHPGQGAYRFEGAIQSWPVGYLTPDERATFSTTKVIYNCLALENVAPKMQVRSSFDTIYPEAIRRRVTSNWARYGLGE